MKSQVRKVDNKKKPRNKVFVGLSGGVDSAVSAALLQREGYEVTGVFIKAWTPEGYPCTWREDRRSAMKVAAVLDIPFITLDLEKEYKKEVVDYMIAEYQAGRTPNPDVMCNKEIKFGHFLKFALDNGADFVATGHYVQVFSGKQSRKASLSKVLGSPVARLNQTFVENFSGLLAEGNDKNKDQSYFLWTLTNDQLKHVLFPIGHLPKPEVRKLAAKFGLPQATRKDSQGLCFLGKIDMKEFLAEYLKTEKGKVLLAPQSFSEEGNEKAEVIGSHDGALLYTIGERHGFKVSNKKTQSEPLYVIKKDVTKNIIFVSPKPVDEAGLLSVGRSEVELKNLNLTTSVVPKKLKCRLRYRQEKVGCHLEGNKVIFDRPQFGVSAGQSLVFYVDDICLGGGVIE